MNLPGIKKIYSVETTSLPLQLEAKSLVGIPITISSTLNELQFFGEPNCTVKQENEQNMQVEEATLEFATTDKLNTDLPLAFLVQDVNDTYYLIGTQEPPFPIITQERETSTPSSGSTCWNIKVTHLAQRALIKCIISTTNA